VTILSAESEEEGRALHHCILKAGTMPELCSELIDYNFRQLRSFWAGSGYEGIEKFDSEFIHVSNF